RIVDRTEPLDRFVRLGEKRLFASFFLLGADEVRRPSELLEGAPHLRRRLAGARQGELVRLAARVAGPEECDLLRHAASLSAATTFDNVTECSADVSSPRSRSR